MMHPYLVDRDPQHPPGALATALQVYPLPGKEPDLAEELAGP